MPTEQIVFGYNSSPTLKFTLLDDYGDPIDITGYTFKLMVKPFLANEDGQLPDARAWFDKTGAIITALDGTYKFDLTPAETGIPAGTYPGEIRAWSGSATLPPTYRISAEVTCEEAVDLP